MRIILVLFILAFLACLPVPAHAGNIYGTIWLNGSPAPGAQIQIQCSSSHPAQTDSNGSYKAFVPENGRCNFHLDFQGHSGDAPIASYANPIKYDFDLVLQGDGRYALRSK